MIHMLEIINRKIDCILYQSKVCFFPNSPRQTRSIHSRTHCETWGLCACLKRYDKSVTLLVWKPSIPNSNCSLGHLKANVPMIQIHDERSLFVCRGPDMQNVTHPPVKVQLSGDLALNWFHCWYATQAQLFQTTDSGKKKWYETVPYPVTVAHA